MGKLERKIAILKGGEMEKDVLESNITGKTISVEGGTLFLRLWSLAISWLA